MITLAVFDMAGTTIDDHGAVYDALEQTVVETGATVAPDDLQQWMGTDKVEAIAALMRLGGVEPEASAVALAFDRFRALLAQTYTTRPPVALPGVEGAIRELQARGIKVALSTGFSTDVAGPLLAQLGWSVAPSRADAALTLDAVVCADEVAAGRPAPYLIHRAMERTGTRDVRQVLTAGDTLVDLESGRNAGAGFVVGVLTGKLGREELTTGPHDAILASVVDVLNLEVLSGP